jgi:hypothetical protein
MTPAGAGFHRLRAATVAAMRIPLRFGWSLAVLALAGCAGDPSPVSAPRTPESIQAEIQSLIPTTVAQRAAWAVDLQLVFAALKIEPTRANVCAVLAVTEQESTYNPDPPVPNLAKVAREEILRRADRAGVPEVAVTLALQLRSRDGRSYDERLAAVRTERELSLMYEDFIAEVPLGRSLLAQHNPVRTAGPMQVSIDFAQAHVRTRPYPFPAEESLRHEVFTRRGGLYFGTAHLLDYPAAYGSEMLYRFADFNAGRWASRNAAFQQAARSTWTAISTSPAASSRARRSRPRVAWPQHSACRTPRSGASSSAATARISTAARCGPRSSRSPSSAAASPRRAQRSRASSCRARRSPGA